MSKRFKLGSYKTYQNCIVDAETKKKYPFSPYMKVYDIWTIIDILNDLCEE